MNCNNNNTQLIIIIIETSVSRLVQKIVQMKETIGNTLQ